MAGVGAALENTAATEIRAMRVDNISAQKAISEVERLPVHLDHKKVRHMARKLHRVHFAGMRHRARAAHFIPVGEHVAAKRLTKRLEATELNAMRPGFRTHTRRFIRSVFFH